MKHLIIILLFLVSITAHAQLSGRYMTNERTFVGGQYEIVLNADSTYNQYITTCVRSLGEVGRYTRSGDTLFMCLKTTDSYGIYTGTFITDTLIYRKKYLTSLGGLRYYKQKKVLRSSQ